jgi:tetratricopeptide (TPR) repeat protein
MAVMIAERTLSINSLTASIGKRSRFAVAALVLHGLVLFLPLLTGAGEAEIPPPTTERRAAFLAAVEGPWEGQARVTPTGPRPYDMTFVRTTHSFPLPGTCGIKAARQDSTGSTAIWERLTDALATAGGEAALQALANQSLGFAYQFQGDYHRAIDCLGQTMASLDSAQRPERFGRSTLPVVTSRTWLVMCHAELEMFTEGRTLGEEGLRIAEAVDHPASLMVASWGLGLLFLRQGDLPRALPRLERAVGLCQDANLPVYFPLMASPLGTAYTMGGRVTNAVPLLAQAMEQTMAMERADFQALCHLFLGEAHLLAGRLEEAHALAEEALALARAHQERGHRAYALRLLGEIAMRREPPERDLAEAHCRQALALAEELGMRPLQAHCHRGLGKLYAKVGRRAEARAALSAAVELYRAMEMTLWLPQAEAALAQMR